MLLFVLQCRILAAPTILVLKFTEIKLFICLIPPSFAPAYASAPGKRRGITAQFSTIIQDGQLTSSRRQRPVDPPADQRGLTAGHRSHRPSQRQRRPVRPRRSHQRPSRQRPVPHHHRQHEVDLSKSQNAQARKGPHCQRHCPKNPPARSSRTISEGRQGRDVVGHWR